jgi:hypothetical protein
MNVTLNFKSGRFLAPFGPVELKRETYEYAKYRRIGLRVAR